MTTALDTRMESAAARRTTKRPRFYAPELDNLRFLAFMLVFCRHVATSFGTARHAQAISASAAALPGLAVIPQGTMSPVWLRVQGAAGAFDFGVCLFFFLSSYLITRLLLIEREETGKVNVKDFYVRRALRIWPLYFVFLGFVAVFAHHLPKVTWTRVLASVFFVANWPAVLNGWALSPIDLLWSVSVEEQFYLVWPNCARSGKRGVLAISGVMVALAIGTLCYMGSRPHVLNSAVWANTFVQCLFFAGGAIAGVYVRPETCNIGRLQRILLIGAGFGCWLVASMVCHVAREVSPGVVDLLAGYGLVLVGTFFIFMSFARLNSARLPKVFGYLGKISYGLYVLHVLMLELSISAMHYLVVTIGGRRPPLIELHMASAACALMLTLVFASLSYKYLETPFLQLKKRFTVVPSRPV
jgi:peptidoglycan/LPS O-acetylase OafA/YrhL